MDQRRRVGHRRGHGPAVCRGRGERRGRRRPTSTRSVAVRDQIIAARRAGRLHARRRRGRGRRPRLDRGDGRAVRRLEHPRQLPRASSTCRPLHEYDGDGLGPPDGGQRQGRSSSRSSTAFRYLRRNPRSYVVNVGSISSFVGQASTPAYTASKAAVLGLSRSIALDYAALGLRCNCVCPGITDTPMLREH